MSNTILINDISINGNEGLNTASELSETLQKNTVNALGVDASSRTIWVNGQPYGNAYVNITGNNVEAPLGAEIFNDFVNNKATGKYSHAEGSSTTATGESSHAEGDSTTATGPNSHAEGDSTTAEGVNSHAEGSSTTAMGDYSHAEGSSSNNANIDENDTGEIIISNWNNTKFSLAYGESSHVEGKDSLALGEQSHAEGFITVAKGDHSHTEGAGTETLGTNSHAEGSSTSANGDSSHAEGNSTVAKGENSHAEGTLTKAEGKYSHAEGFWTSAEGGASHTEGQYTTATEWDSHAEGLKTTATGVGSHAEGESTDQANITNDDTVETVLEKWNNASTNNKFSLAYGRGSHVEGKDSLALGEQSHAEGFITVAKGDHSHTEGAGTETLGTNSHAEGSSTSANGDSSHAEGNSTVAKGENSHAEGVTTTAEGDNSHAEGQLTTAEGVNSHAEGQKTTAGGDNSHIEGSSTNKAAILEEDSETDIYNKWIYNKFSLAHGDCSHAEGLDNLALGDNSHAEGFIAIAKGKNSHAEGNNTFAEGDDSHAEGDGTLAEGKRSHAEGGGSTAKGEYSHAEGYVTTSKGNYSHAEGNHTTAYGDNSHAEGYSRINANIEEGDDNATIISKWQSQIFSLAYGDSSHVEGFNNLALGYYSHAEGDMSLASGNKSHAEGENTKAYGTGAHTEGGYGEAKGEYSHAEGYLTIAEGKRSHAEGGSTISIGLCSHAEGYDTTAQGSYSHAEGEGTITTLGNDAEHAQGRYNASNTNTIHSVGIGTSINDRKNAYEILNTGKHYIYNLGGYDGTNPSDSKDIATILSTVDESDTNGFNVEKTLTVNGDIKSTGNIFTWINGDPESKDGDTASGLYMSNRRINSHVGGSYKRALISFSGNLNEYETEVTKLTDVNLGSYCRLTIGSEKYPTTVKGDAGTDNWGLDCNNSDVVGVNSIVFNDTAENATEGILFKHGTKTDDAHSAIWVSGNANNSVPKFSRNVQRLVHKDYRNITDYDIYYSGANLKPSTTGAYDIGSSDYRFKSLYLSGNIYSDASNGGLVFDGKTDNKYNKVFIQMGGNSVVGYEDGTVELGTSNFNTNIKGKTSITLYGPTTVNNSLTVANANATTLGGTLTVTGTSNLGNVIIGNSGDSTPKSVTVYGKTIFHNTVTTYNQFEVIGANGNSTISAFKINPAETTRTIDIGYSSMFTLTFKGTANFKYGDVTIGDNDDSTSRNLTVNGNALATAFYERSDATKKDIVSNLNVDFDKLKQIPKVNFTWKNDPEKKNNIGTIAQELNKVYPELVNGEEGNMTVDYAKLSIIALAAIDKLEDRIKQLEDKLSEYEK